MKQLILLAVVFGLFACSQGSKKFSRVSIGMTKSLVITNAGEPSGKNNIGPVELWVYPDADRTVVFRKDTVYNIITSAYAPIDSIEISLKQAGIEMKKNLESTEDPNVNTSIN